MQHMLYTVANEASKPIPCELAAASNHVQFLKENSTHEMCSLILGLTSWLVHWLLYFLYYSEKVVAVWGIVFRR